MKKYTPPEYDDKTQSLILNHHPDDIDNYRRSTDGPTRILNHQAALWARERAEFKKLLKTYEAGVTAIPWVWLVVGLSSSWAAYYFCDQIIAFLAQYITMGEFSAFIAPIFVLGSLNLYHLGRIYSAFVPQKTATEMVHEEVGLMEVLCIPESEEEGQWASATDICKILEPYTDLTPIFHERPVVLARALSRAGFVKKRTSKNSLWLIKIIN
jgi:hypothetical protein